MKINWLLVEMGSTFSSIRSYFELIDKNQVSIITEEAAKVVDELRALDDWGEENPPPTEEQMASQLTDSVEEIKTRSLIVNLNDRVEYYLRRLCKAIQHEQKDKISYSDFVGTPIEKTNKYLIHLKRPQLSKDYLDVFSEFQILRNCIVHCNGIVKESRDLKYLSKVSKEDRGIRIISGFLEIDRDYVAQRIEQVIKMMHDIYKQNGWGLIS